MTDEAVITAGDWTLRRAGMACHDAVVSLQRAAYARNRDLLGVTPLPLLADYRVILRDKEVWLAVSDAGVLAGVLVLEHRPGDLMIESVATDPGSQGQGLGRAMLSAAETRARNLGYGIVRLYTGSVLTHLIDWYRRHGFAVDRIETLSDRTITHMMKRLAD